MCIRWNPEHSFLKPLFSSVQPLIWASLWVFLTVKKLAKPPWPSKTLFYIFRWLLGCLCIISAVLLSLFRLVIAWKLATAFWKQLLTGVVQIELPPFIFIDRLTLVIILQRYQFCFQHCRLNADLMTAIVYFISLDWPTSWLIAPLVLLIISCFSIHTHNLEKLAMERLLQNGRLKFPIHCLQWGRITRWRILDKQNKS